MNIGTKYEQSGMVTGNRVVLLDEWSILILR